MIDDKLAGSTVGLDARPVGNPFARWLIATMRLIFGYIVAVGAGAVIFAVLSNTVPFEGIWSPPTPDKSAWLQQTTNSFYLFFVLGLVFGLPYTILGSMIFRFVLPRNAWTFMAIGLLSPTVAIFLVGIGLGGTIWFDPQLAKLALLTLPSGIVATYLFGAIGFGLGFRRWRFA